MVVNLSKEMLKQSKQQGDCSLLGEKEEETWARDAGGVARGKEEEAGAFGKEEAAGARHESGLGGCSKTLQRLMDHVRSGGRVSRVRFPICALCCVEFDPSALIHHLCILLASVVDLYSGRE